MVVPAAKKLLVFFCIIFYFIGNEIAISIIVYPALKATFLIFYSG